MVNRDRMGFMEEMPKISGGKEKLISKLEVVFSDMGSPSQRVGLRIDGKDDPAFLLGFGKFFKSVSMEELQRIFPYLVEIPDNGKPKLKINNLAKLIDDDGGLKELSKYLDIPIDIIKESRGRVIDQQTVTQD